MARACFVAAVLCFLGLSRPASSRADDAAPAVFVATGVPDEDAAALRAAVARELNLEVIDPDAVPSRLSALARRAPRDDLERRVGALERRALERYLHLRIEESEAAWDEAMQAALGDARRPADPARLSQLAFGRALVRLAAQRSDAAERDLALAKALDPSFAPSPDEYGPPVLRALEQAERSVESAREIDLRIDRSPALAEVRVDGQLVGGTTARVRGGMPHLVTVSHPGFAPRSLFVDVGDAAPAPVGIVLTPAPRGIAAEQALALWRASAGGEPTPHTMPHAAAPFVARALGASRIVIALPAEEGALAASLVNAETGELVREARGRRVAWEATPFFVLAAALAGRMIEPPAPSVVALAVTAPATVEPSAELPLSVQLTDPERRAQRLVARCGDVTASHEAPRSRAAVRLALSAPSEEGRVECSVSAVDGLDRVLGGEPRGVTVLVEEAAPPWYGRVAVWAVILGALAAGAAAAAIGVTASQDPQQVLRIHGP